MKNVYRVILLSMSLLVFSSVPQLFAQWEQSGGPYGGVINGVACVGSVMLAGTNSGLFRSTDSGASWHPLAMELNGGPQNVYGLQVSDSGIYAGTNSSIFASTDSGATWQQVGGGVSIFYGQPVPFIEVSGNLIAVDHNDEMFIFPLSGTFGTGQNVGALYFSNGGLQVDTTLQCAAFAGTSIFAGTNFGVYVSSDSGKAWVNSDSGLTRINVTALASIGNDVFAGTDSDGVFRSTNNGGTWTAVNSGLTTPFIKSLASNGSDIYAGTNGGGVFVSTNDGATWTQMNSGLTNPVVNSIAFDGTKIIAGTDGNGVFSYDGTWTQINSGLTATVVNAFAANGSALFAGTDGGGVFLSTDNGSSWMPTNSGMTNLYVQALCVKGGDLYAGTHGGGVFVSTDNGSTWSPRNDGINEKNIVALIASGNNLLAGSGFPIIPVITGPNNPVNFGAIFLSIDNGTTWSKVDSDQMIIRAFSSIGSDVIAAGWTQADRSTCYGETWTHIDSGLSYEISPFGATSPIPIDCFCASDGELFAGTGGQGEYMSTDDGVSWQPVNKNLYFVTAACATGNNILVSSYSEGYSVYGMGVSRSTVDSVTSWTAVDSDFVDVFLPPPHLPPIVNALIASGGYLLAGTDGIGVWRVPLSQVTGVEEVQRTTPTSFVLEQNYPNPFNPTTVIKFEVRGSGLVSLKVYNVLGQLVKTLVDKVESPGSHAVTFDAAGLASGVYFYRLAAGSYVMTKKMLLLK